MPNLIRNVSRRLAWIALIALAMVPVWAAGKVVLYAATGPQLTQYDVDVDGARLVPRASVTLPDAIQYAWPHPSKPFLYVGWSNGAGANHHGLSALQIDSTGALHLHGDPVTLPARPVHITVDISGTHVLAAFNDPSGLAVYPIKADGTIGSRVAEPDGLDFGIYAHQVRVDPSNRMVILVTRGNGPTARKREDPGALKVFGYKDGILSNRASIAPHGGYGFQPRHLDFDPQGPWVFVSLERQSQLEVYKKLSGDTLSAEPVFTVDSLAIDGARRDVQASGTVHVDPRGRFVYQANRAGATVRSEGKRVFAGGENSIAVYSVNRETGEPTRIQNADTRGFEPRTFALDPSGRLLVVANQNAQLVPEGQGVKLVPASLAVFRIRENGTLDFVRKYDVDTKAGSLFWMGLVPLH